MPHDRARLAAALVVAGLLAACGTRADSTLLEEARNAELAVGNTQANPGTVPVTSNNPTTGTPGTPVSGPTAPATGQPGPADAGDPTDGAGGDNVPDGSVDGSQGDVDTRLAPAGGNGGATDVGVTADEIVIGNVADITGAVAGLFADVQKAAQAYELYFRSTEGTIYGRQVRLVPMDSALTRNGNFSAYTQLCDSAFMAVASMSAFDEGIEEPVRNCGIPDLRTVAVNPSIMTLPTMYSGDAIGPNRQPLSEYLYWAETFPEAVRNAAYIFVDNNTTRAQTAMVRSGTEQIGWNWKVYAPVDVAAISYKTQIREMKNQGVRLVTFTGAYQQAAKLAREMVEESFQPDVFVLQANVYDARLIDEGGANLEQFPVQLAAIGPLVEEIEHHPELQTYREWLKYVDPTAEPTGLGMYAWSAMRLAITLLKQIGPEPTREAMVEAMSQVSGWTGNDLVPPQEVGAREPTDCTIILEIRDGAFERIHPAEPGTFSCRNRVVTTS